MTLNTQTDDNEYDDPIENEYTTIYPEEDRCPICLNTDCEGINPNGTCPEEQEYIKSLESNNPETHKQTDKLTDEIFNTLIEAMNLISEKNLEKLNRITDDYENAIRHIADSAYALKYGEWLVCNKCGTERSTKEIEKRNFSCPSCGYQTNEPIEKPLNQANEQTNEPN